MQESGARLAFRMTVAAVVADLGTTLFGLPEGYWAVITCLVVVQGTLGATLDAALGRLLATVAGGVAGAAGGWLCVQGVPQALALAALMVPLALLAAYRPRYRLAPITAALVMLAIPGRSEVLAVAGHRIAEIFLGGFIGAAVSLFLLPDRGSTRARHHAATAIATLAELVSRHLGDGSDIERLNARLNAALADTMAAATEARHERSFGFSSGPDTDPLLRTLRRLRTDVAMLGRIVPGTPFPPCIRDLARALSSWLTVASKALAEAGLPPSPAAIPVLDDAPDDPLQLVFAVLRRDLVDLAERIREHHG